MRPVPAHNIVLVRNGTSEAVGPEPEAGKTNL